MVFEKFFSSVLLLVFLLFSASFAMEKASLPDPCDGQLNVGDPIIKELYFNWTPAPGMISQNFYLGMNYSAVESADTSSTEFQKSTTRPMLYITSYQTDTWYYWRVDEITATGTTKGDVWSFKTFGRDPVVWYKFDESSGTVANDSSDNGFNATINRSDRWQQTAGRWGGCLANVPSGYLDVLIPPAAFSSVNNEITISFWIWTDFQNQTEKLFRGYNSSRARIVDMYMNKSSSSEERYLYFSLGQNSTSVYDLRSWSEYKPISIGDENQWHHVALVRDTTQGVDVIYYDGVLQTTWYHDAAKTLEGMDTFHLFNGGSILTSESFHGKIDDFRIYNVALTPYEIAKVYGREIYAADFDGDTIVGMDDLKILASQWLSSDKNVTADADGDGDVDMVDYSIMVKYWCKYDLAKPGYKLVFHDEFDGNDVDEFLWSKGSRWGTGVDSIAAFMDDACVVNNGILYIFDEKRLCYDIDGTPKEYSTGSLRTDRKFEYNYGWYEVRCQMPGYRGSFPAFWLFPHHDTYYPRAEIDIMEHIYSWGNVTSCNMHWNGYGTEHQSLGAQKYNVPNIWTQFHTYSMLWSPGNLKFYADGYMFYEYSGPEVPAEAMYIILNGMVRDYYGAGIDDALLPASFKVDYVRVYKKL